MQAEIRAIGHRKGDKIEPKGDQNAHKIEPKGCLKPPRDLLDGILSKMGNSVSKWWQSVPQAGTENGQKNLIRSPFRHPVVPKGRSKAYFWEVAKVAEEISQNLSHNDASSIPQNGVST